MSRLLVLPFYNGRTDRASLQIEVTAFDEWNCRADVACVGADLRVRPQNRLRSGEDRRTHRSARRIDYSQVRTGGHIGPPLRWKLPPRRAVHPKRSRPSLRNEKKLRFLLACELRKQRVTRLIVTRFALTQWTHDHESIQILVLQHLMAGFVVLM